MPRNAACGCQDKHKGPHPTCPHCASGDTKRVRNYGRPVGNEWWCLKCKRRWELSAPSPERRKLLRGLRKGVKVMRRFTVEAVGEDQEKTTCTTCGWSETKPHGITDKSLAKRLTAYRAQGGGVTGVCPRCTKKARDEKYPLHA